ncbi:linoleoyl-CoA desaturase [Filimonas lacunae]|uniref:Linoleoyl-CoA desaturase n=1 Tax=Filimonas lacunae TaxID=477680 RepID=A0A173MK53_9BACT|nr:acyl-CoA desaturase [Filimonas lacunae]BAV07849.1 linoleoyl-CoA desaturase [Filimonas lacunae]SIT05594.1 linoleoyl-CoA desaturase [Filimonas lacunae]
MLTPKFAHVKQSFHVELKKRINEYFTTTGKSTTGGIRLFSKALFLILAITYTYIQLVFFTPGVLASVGLCILMGLLVASIGFNVMHDGGHGSFSRSTAVNKVAAVTAEILGASHFMWNMKHNVIHHAFTNIDGIDDDIDAKPFLRMTSTQKYYKMHRFQHVYFIVLYAIFHLYWVLFSDYKKYFSGKIGEMPIKKMKPVDHLTFWGFKLVHYALFFVIPIVVLGFSTWIIGFSIVSLITGFTLSIVFQLAHTVEHTEFPMPDEGGRLQDEWAVHQLKTTANFATRSKLVSWYVGGLNFQVEHHLFPKISHIHYPAINKIVKQACAEYNVVYVEYPRMSSAVISHVNFLRQMGKA